MRKEQRFPSIVPRLMIGSNHRKRYLEVLQRNGEEMVKRKSREQKSNWAWKEERVIMTQGKPFGPRDGWIGEVIFKM